MTCAISRSCISWKWIGSTHCFSLLSTCHAFLFFLIQVKPQILKMNVFPVISCVQEAFFYGQSVTISFLLTLVS